MIRVRMKQLSPLEIDTVLEQKRSWILGACAESGCAPVRVIAFGSAGRGELREDSDIDLAILFADETQLRNGRDAVRKAPREDMWPLDLLFYTTEEFESRADSGGVCMLVRNEGRVLYNTEGRDNESKEPGTPFSG